MKNEQQLSQIERYLNGLLSNEETTIFEQRLKTDPAFQEEFRLHRVSLEAIAAHGSLKDRISRLNEKVREAEALPQKSGRVIRFTPWVAAAAAVLVLALGYWLMMETAPSLDEQMALYDQPDAALRSGTDEAFERAYKDQDYQKSVEIYETNPDKELAFPAAYAYKKTNNYQKAHAIWDEIIRQNPVGTNAKHQNRISAHWQKAMAYINQKQLQEAKKEINLVIGDEHCAPTLREQAKRLLKVL